METNAKTDWYFPDTYLPDISDGISHEAVCVLNLSDREADVTLTLYFEDRGPMTGFSAVCGANRTNHIRLDRIRSADGSPIPQTTPYSIALHASVPVFAQYTRLDATKPPYTLMTAMGL